MLLPATPGWVSLPVLVGGPRHSWLGSAGGGGVWCVVCGGGVLVGLWLVCGVVGPSPLLAEVPVCYSPPLLAGFRCRWWWAVPATPGWGPLAALVCGVWCVAVVCWWGCGWCVVWLVPRHSWRRFLCATPRHSWLGFAAGGGGRSPPLLAGVRWRQWCVVCGVWCVGCGVWRWCVGGVLAGVWCGWSLATPGGGSCVLLPATPCWVSLPVLVGGPRHSWLGSAGGGGVWCVVCWWGPSPFLAGVPVCYSPPLLAGFRCRWWWAVPATPGWGLLAAVVCGVWCVVCGVWRWCVGGVVVGVWCGWSLATPGGGSCVLLPATPGWVSLPVVVGGPHHSWLGSAGGGGVWCVVCGVWVVVCGGGVLVGFWLVCGVVGPSPLLAEVPVCYSPPLLAGFRCRCWWAVPATPGWGPLAAVVCGVWCVGGVPRPSWRGFLCATPRHSWLGFAAGGGGRSPPLLAGVCWRRWCVLCGVWCVVCGGGVLMGLWLVCGVVGPSPLLAEVPVCYSPPLLAGFRCRWWWAVPATAGWGPPAAVVCGVWCVCWGPSPLLAEVPVCYSQPLLAGFRCRWWWAVPATPGWGPLAAVVCGVWCVVCGVWCVAVVCWWGCGWCVVWLVPRHSWRWFLCATPRHSWLGSAAGGGGRSPPLLAGVRWRRWCVVCGVWCLVCGVWRWCVGGVVAGVWWGWSLATPGGDSCVLLPATPGWVSLPVVVGGPRHSWLGSAGVGGVWCVVCGV